MNEIPENWIGHYSEEELYDIRVLVDYWHETPQSAVVSLRLKPSPPPIPEKQAESKQTEKIEVKPEISKEVKMDEQNEKKIDATDFFPGTDFSGKESAGWFPKTSFSDQVEFPTEPVCDGDKRGRTSMPINDFPLWLQHQVESAHTMGHLARTLKFYTGVMDGGELVDQTTLKQFGKFTEEVESAQDYKEQEAVLEKITKYLRGMKTQGR